MDLALDYEGFHPTVLVYFRDRLEEQKAERMIFGGIVKLLVELGLVKRKGKQRLDSTHIVGYVKAMSWLECAMETLRLGLEDLEPEVGRKKRPEFWQRLWVSYVQSKLDWRLSKTEHPSRYFATQVSAQVTDPNTVKNSMRYTRLNTTSRYTRMVMERMKDAVQNLGVSFGVNEPASNGTKRQKTAFQGNQHVSRDQWISTENVEEKIGGGGRSRTYDAADMSRVL